MTLISALKDALNRQQAPKDPRKEAVAALLASLIRNGKVSPVFLDDVQSIAPEVDLQVVMASRHVDLAEVFERMPRVEGYEAQRQAMEEIMTSLLPAPVEGTNVFLNAPIVPDCLRWGFLQSRKDDFHMITPDRYSDDYEFSRRSGGKLHQSGLGILRYESDETFDREQRFRRLWTQAEKRTGVSLLMPRQTSELAAIVDLQFQKELDRITGFSRNCHMTAEELRGYLPAEAPCIASADLSKPTDRAMVHDISQRVGAPFGPLPVEHSREAAMIHAALSHPLRVMATDVLMGDMPLTEAHASIMQDERIEAYATAIRQTYDGAMNFDSKSVELLKGTSDGFLLSAFGAAEPATKSGYAPWIYEENQIRFMKISNAARIILRVISDRHEETALGSRMCHALRAYAQPRNSSISDAGLSKMIDKIELFPELASRCMNLDESEGINRFLSSQLVKAEQIGSQPKGLMDLFALKSTPEKAQAFFELAAWTGASTSGPAYLERRLEAGNFEMPDYFNVALAKEARLGRYTVEKLVEFGMGLEETGHADPAHLVQLISEGLSGRSVLRLAIDCKFDLEKTGLIDTAVVDARVASLSDERALIERILPAIDNKPAGRIENLIMVLNKNMQGPHPAALDAMFEPQEWLNAADYEHFLSEANRVIYAGRSDYEAVFREFGEAMKPAQEHPAPAL